MAGDRFSGCFQAPLLIRLHADYSFNRLTFHSLLMVLRLLEASLKLSRSVLTIAFQVVVEHPKFGFQSLDSLRHNNWQSINVNFCFPSSVERLSTSLQTPGKMFAEVHSELLSQKLSPTDTMSMQQLLDKLARMRLTGFAVFTVFIDRTTQSPIGAGLQYESVNRMKIRNLIMNRVHLLSQILSQMVSQMLVKPNAG